MREQATYVSVWEEGNIETKCAIVDGNQIVDIEVSELGAEYEHLLEEYVIYRDARHEIDTEHMTLLETPVLK